MVQLKADLQREYEYGQKNGGAPHDMSQYRPLPLEAGLRVNNDVVVSLVAPARWKIFNPTQGEIDKYNLSSIPVFSDPEWGTLYFRVPTHKVRSFSFPNGSTGFAYTICPVHMNKYLVEGLNLSPMFDTPVRCAYCEESENWWQRHNARWEELGIDKKSLSKQGYRDQISGDKELRLTKDKAYEYKPTDRFILSIFDHAKFSGARPLDEGQTGVAWQSWYAPNSVYEKIRTLYTSLAESGMPMFFDFDQPRGVPILTVVKDTTACSTGNMLATEYDVTMIGKTHQYPSEWVAYLKNEASYADPSSYLHLISYEDQKYYLEQDRQKVEAKSFNKPKASPMVGGSSVGATPLPPAVPQQVAVPAAPVMAATPPAVPSFTPVAAPPMGAPAQTPPVIPALATPSAKTFVPAAPVPAIGGGPIPNRTPPQAMPPAGGLNWDE